MSLPEITSAVAELTTDEIVALERSLHAILRQRGAGLVYNDEYGAMSETELLSEADAAFAAYDAAEADAG